MQWRKSTKQALTVKLSKYNVDDVALGVCKTGAEEAGVTEVRTSLSEKKFELWREIYFSSRRQHTSSLRDWSSDVCSSDLRRRTGRNLPVLRRPDPPAREGA